MTQGTLQKLNEPLPEIQELDELIAKIDHCLSIGFSRLTPAEIGIFETLHHILQDTLIAQRIGKLKDAFNQNLLTETDFETLAIARATLQNLKYQVLQDHLASCLRRDSKTIAHASMRSREMEPILDGLRTFLKDIAITGFERVGVDILDSFQTTLETILGYKELQGLTALLSGFYNELLDVLPVNSRESIPLNRWVDLWTRLFVKTIQVGIQSEGMDVDGEFFPLGSELLHHQNLIAVRFHGIFESDENKRIVQLTFSTFKVNLISFKSIWNLFPQLDTFFRALSNSSSLLLKNCVIFPTGDVVYAKNSKPSKGKAFNRSAILSKYMTIGSPEETITFYNPHPMHRHPVMISEPLFLDSFTIAEEKDEYSIQVEGVSLAIRFKRSFPELDSKILSAATQVFGHIKYDNGIWLFHPLLVTTASGESFFAGVSAIELYNKPPKKNQVAMLKERASRLLRG